jgi:hypothetical protein
MIKTLSITQLEELFKIIQSENCQYTTNNNGVFLNLTWLEESLLDKIELFINFCDASKKELERYEDMCRELYKCEGAVEREQEGVVEKEGASSFEEESSEKRILPRVSSSMKFYLLKKKFAKVPSGVFNSYDHLLEKEPYIKK